MTITPTASYTFRENVVDGDPTSGINNPDLSDIRTWAEWIEQLIVTGALADATWKATKTLLLADLAHDATAKAVVYLDMTPENNGFYEKSGASGSGTWTQLSTFLPGAQIVRATDTGASTGTAYVMATSPRLPAGDGQALVLATVPVTNTGDDPTIKFDGGTGLTIISAAGASISNGALVAGMPLVGLISGNGSFFRLTTDYSSAANLAAAEAARDAARNYAEAAQQADALSGATDQRALAEAAAAVSVENAEVATTAAAEAQIAADAAQLSAGIFPDTAAGLSGTDLGGYFSVPSATANEFVILYRHDAGPVATFVKIYPSSIAIDSINAVIANATSGVYVPGFYADIVEILLDETGRVLTFTDGNNVVWDVDKFGNAIDRQAAASREYDQAYVPGFSGKVVVAEVDEAGRALVVIDNSSQHYVPAGLGGFTKLASTADIDALIAGLGSGGGNSFDVIVVGGGEAGAMAAIGAARRGASVLLVSEDEFIGGHSGWSISFPDVDTGGVVSPYVLTGVAKEFFKKVALQQAARDYLRYIRTAARTKPAWVLRSWADMIGAENITILKNLPLRSATIEPSTKRVRVSFGSAEDPISFAAPIIVDATTTGDIPRMTGMSNSIGREATTRYGEATAGVQVKQAWPGSASVDPYVTPGDSVSGLLYGIDPGINGDGSAPEAAGSGDGRVMPFSHRLFLTSVASDKISWSVLFADGAPEDYNAARYEMLGRAFASAPSYYNDSIEGLGRVLTFYNCGDESGTTIMGPSFHKYADINDAGAFSIAYPVTTEVLEYVTATPERRAEIRAKVKNFTLGFFYWLLFEADARIPSAIRTALNAYGFSNKEWSGYGGWSPCLYVREGARLVGDYVMSDVDIAPVLAGGYTDVIGHGYYSADSKLIRHVIDAGVVKTEGAQLDLLPIANSGFPFPYRTLLPKASECVNLLCPGQPSVSRQLWLRLRMSPNMMQFGYAAGWAAAIAAQQGIGVQEVDGAQLARELDLLEVADKQVITTGSSNYYSNTGSATFGGAWSFDTPHFPLLGQGIKKASAGANTITFAPNVFTAGPYLVSLLYPVSQDGANALSVTINHADGTAVRTVNQRYPGGSGGFWEPLGIYNFRYGAPSPDTVVVNAAGAGGDVRLVALGLKPMFS